MTARQVLDALTQQTLEGAWDEYRDSAIAPEVAAEEVEARREAYMAGAVGMLMIEHAARGLKRPEAIQTLDRLREEGKMIGGEIVDRHIAAAEAQKETKQ
jgi:hypothetical protein